MADQKLTDLTATTSPASTDLVYLVVDPSGTPLDRKVTVGNLRGPGAILASKSYDPGTLMNASTTSATFADVDATNLAVTFTAPTSGSVMVLLEATCNCDALVVLRWNLRSGASDVSGTSTRIQNNADTSFALQQRKTAHLIVAGLTAGTSYTYKWGHAREAGTGNCQTFAGGVVGPATMVVFAL